MLIIFPLSPKVESQIISQDVWGLSYVGYNRKPNINNQEYESLRMIHTQSNTLSVRTSSNYRSFIVTKN